METLTEDKRSEEQAKAQYDSIAEMVENLTKADDDARDDVEQVIHEDALSVEVREGWHAPTDEVAKPEEYTILLCTGGPAVRIIGELNQYLEPETANIQHQDWFTPWKEYRLTDEEEETLLIYARCFWFGG